MNIILKPVDPDILTRVKSLLGYPVLQVLFLLFLILNNGCISQFIPETSEDPNILVVEGLITDQPGPNTIKLTNSLPLGGSNAAKPLTRCIVTITDDLGSNFALNETKDGTYITPEYFQGVVGRSYTLHIRTGNSGRNLSYQSFPVEMRSVPPIDSVYYEKMVTNEKYIGSQPAEGCQIYLNTHDPENICKFYRWEFSETWQFRLPYSVPNSDCWISSSSDKINIKSTASFGEGRIVKYPLNFVSNMTDRLKVQYSILVKQYSLSEDEYLYWEKLQNIAEHVGGLYDITPSSIPSNIWCVENPDEKILGYFSVSACSSKRIFIKDNFAGIIDLYNNCIADTVFGGGQIPNLNTFVWVIINVPFPPPGYRVLTRIKGCYDCTVRGTNIMPDFWRDDKKYLQKNSK